MIAVSILQNARKDLAEQFSNYYERYPISFDFNI